MYKKIAPLLIAILVFPSMGFVCSSRLETVEASVGALELQFTEIQQRINNDQTQLTEMIVRADKKIAEIEALQNKDSMRTAQSSVDLSLQLEAEKAEVANLRGKLEVQQRQLEELQNNLRTVMSSVSSTGNGSAVILPSGQDELYQFILTNREAKNVANEKAGAIEFYNRYPNDSRTESILATLPELCISAGSNQEAISYASYYIQKYPKGARINDVLFQLGTAGANIGNCNIATQTFQRLADSNYPNAAQKLKEVKASCK